MRVERDESGIAVLLPTDSSGVVSALRAAVGASGRFHLLAAPGIRLAARMPLLEPEPPVTLAERNRWLGLTQARWLVFGSVGQHDVQTTDPNSGSPVSTVSYDIALRVFDLDLGDTGPVFTGSDSDPAALAQDALRFLRAQYPIHAHVTSVDDNGVYLDVGTRDGVTQGETFTIVRHPGPYGEQVGSVQVSTAADWYSQCQVEDQVKGRNPEAGDTAVEDTTSFLDPQQ